MMEFKRYVLSAVVVSSLVASNIAASKIAYFDILGGVAIPAGFVGIGIAFLCTDLLSELYGKDVARKTINSAIIALVVSIGVIGTAIKFTPAPFYTANDEFVQIMSSGYGVLVAGIVTLVISQNLDVSVFHRLKTFTGGRHKWLRNLGSTTVSQFVDTAIFIGLAFAIIPYFGAGEPRPLMIILNMIAGQYVLKLIIAMLDTPIFYLLSYETTAKNEDVDLLNLQ